ncbi:winged helix-turn-helix transcriptional regulator [Candidatus Bathyarchaeota archaeon]|jgi:DNA-binding Lrp family transcriptional regulator|nr:winged helix-turn-helix transcriptional regulator [Candidatus Bathyarchaeota archaeon]
MIISTDSTDLKILAELVENAKSSFVDIGKKLELHPNVVAYRVNKLERLGIIKDYTTRLDLEKLGLSEQIFVAISLPGNLERERILQEIASMPQTTQVVCSLGEPESILFLVGKNKADLDRTMWRLRNMNVKIEYTGSIVRTYEEGGLCSFLKLLAEEFGESKDLCKQPVIAQ